MDEGAVASWCTQQMNEDPVARWIAKAEHDLKIARDEMATEEPVTDMVSFHPTS